MEGLEAAAAALDVGDPAGALEALLDAWREGRSPRVADLIDDLTAMASRALPHLVEARRTRFHEAWLDLANRNRAIDVGLLLEGWATQPWTKLGERVDRLAQRGDDPRIALALARFIEALPTTNGAGEGTWSTILRLVASARDVRCRAPIAARIRAGGPGVFWQNLLPRVTAVLEGLVAVTPAEPTDAAVAKVFARLQVARQGPAWTEAVLRRPKPTKGGLDEGQLLDRIYDQPADDAARLVYADFLTERDDPRGELIALQFKPLPSGKELRRIKDLLKLHGRAWCGPVEPAVGKKTEAFARGFLSACRVDFRTEAQRKELLLHPAWNTLTALWHPDDGGFLLPHPLKGLEVYHQTLPPPLAAAMARRPKPYPRLARIRVSLENAERDHLGAVAEGAAFPALTHLGLQGLGQREEVRAIETFDWLFAAPLMQRLETVEVQFLNVNVIDWLKRLAAFPKVKKLELSTWPVIHFHREAAGWNAHVLSTTHGEADQAWVLEAIAKAGLLTSVVLSPPGPGEEDARAKLVATLPGIPIVGYDG